MQLPVPRQWPPGAAAQLPMPTQMFVTFRNNLFNDQTKDPHLGVYLNLYSTFDVDPNNQNASRQPAAIRDLICLMHFYRLN